MQANSHSEESPAPPFIIDRLPSNLCNAVAWTRRGMASRDALEKTVKKSGSYQELFQNLCDILQNQHPYVQVTVMDEKELLQERTVHHAYVELSLAEYASLRITLTHDFNKRQDARRKAQMLALHIFFPEMLKIYHGNEGRSERDLFKTFIEDFQETKKHVEVKRGSWFSPSCEVSKKVFNLLDEFRCSLNYTHES